jgi:hypothetical protein
VSSQEHALAAQCATCGTKLGFRRRLGGETRCEGCQARSDDEQTAAINAYRTAVASMVTGTDVDSTLPDLARRAGLEGAALTAENITVVRRLIERAVDDEYLTVGEEAAIASVVERLGFTPGDLREALDVHGSRLAIARAAAGRLPHVAQPSIILKRGEEAHLEVEAQLMKEVVHRETRGGYAGVSIPIAKGIRFHTGRTRGRSVVVGTSLVVADHGVLCVTSRRAVFKGLRQSVESQFTKLVGVNLFDDAVQFHVSNRKNATLIRVPDGYLVGAVVHAATQRGS